MVMRVKGILTMTMDIVLPVHPLAHRWWVNRAASWQASGGTALSPIPFRQIIPCCRGPGLDQFVKHLQLCRLGNGTQFGEPMAAITPTAVTGSFILSADLQVSGLLPQLTNADVTISKVQFIDDGNGNVIFDFTGDAGYIGSNYVQIAVPFSSLSYAGEAMRPILSAI